MSDERLSDKELADLIENGHLSEGYIDFEALLDSIASELLSARQRIARGIEATYASDDGSEYEHNHGHMEGHAECPACWAEDIQDALKEN